MTNQPETNDQPLTAYLVIHNGALVILDPDRGDDYGELLYADSEEQRADDERRENEERGRV